MPLHQFNLNQLIPKKDTEDIEETVIIEQKIIKETRVSKGTKLQEFDIDDDEHKRAVLEAIDHKVLLNLELIEKRKNIVNKRTIRKKSEKSQPSLGELSLGPKGSDSILEPVPQKPVLPTLLPKKKILKDEKATQQKQEEGRLFGLKLKKAEIIKRSWDEVGIEDIHLKHHEFERIPQDVQVKY